MNNPGAPAPGLFRSPARCGAWSEAAGSNTSASGDKRTQIVYDVDETTDEETMAKITELAESPFALGFGPDTLAEARNRGYRLAE